MRWWCVLSTLQQILLTCHDGWLRSIQAKQRRRKIAKENQAKERTSMHGVELKCYIFSSGAYFYSMFEINFRFEGIFSREEVAWDKNNPIFTRIVSQPLENLSKTLLILIQLGPHTTNSYPNKKPCNKSYQKYIKRDTKRAGRAYHTPHSSWTTSNNYSPFFH